jgi:hypothetical protein
LKITALAGGLPPILSKLAWKSLVCQGIASYTLQAGWKKHRFASGLAKSLLYRGLPCMLPDVRGISLRFGGILLLAEARQA